MLGIHVYRKPNKTIAECINYEKELANDMGVDLKCVQIFIFGPQDHKFLLDNQDIQDLYEITSNDIIEIFVHNAYVTPLNDNKKNWTLIKKQLNICDQIGASGFIIHVTNRSPNELVELLNKIEYNNYDTTIYLENSISKQMNYGDLDQLEELVQVLPKQIGLTIDTCHLYVSGIDLTTHQNVKDYLGRLKQIIKIGYPANVSGKILNTRNIMFHLNDSQMKLGSHIDKHGYFGESIWKSYRYCWKKSGLYVFIKYIIKNNLPFIFERKKHIIQDYKIMLKMSSHFQL